MLEIKSVGPPPERYADRVVAEMMREMAKTHATLWDTIHDVVKTSRGGSPKAQRKLAERIKRAGAYRTFLDEGKRGKFEIMIYDFTGYDIAHDAEIRRGDRIPDKPWISCNLSVLTSPGNGRDMIEVHARPILFISVHALSRMAQRFGMRTPKHLRVAIGIIYNACIKLINDGKDEKAWLNAPSEGWRVPIPPIPALAVLKRHEKRHALVCATVIPEDEHDHSDSN